MDLLTASDFEIARLVLQRGVGLVYLVAFVVILDQFRPLLGERGLLPVPNFLEVTDRKEVPGLFALWGYTDRRLVVAACVGTVVASGVVIGISDLVPLPLSFLVWAVLYFLYLSVVNVGQTFYAFGWESLLLEAGVTVAFLGNAEVAPPLLGILAARWLLFRVEFGAGMIKMRGDPCWRTLTCTEYHHETQPMPNPWSRWFHLLPRPLHRLEVAANHLTQLVAPFALFAPQPIAGGVGLLMILTQGYLMLSGNYAWLNFITLLLGFAAIPDGFYETTLRIDVAATTSSPVWFHVLVGMFALFVLFLSRFPLRNLFAKRQLMNYSFNRFHLVNTYGAFGSVTRRRHEVVVEGTLDDPNQSEALWSEYGFRAKPTDPKRSPPQWAPYHLRLDWLMWFAALSPDYARGWFLPFMRRLLENDRATLRLLRHNPFAEGPPRAVRARLYYYRFTTKAERRLTGAVWHRDLLGDFITPITMEDLGQT